VSDEEPTQVDEGTRAFFSSLPPRPNEPEKAGAAHTEPITGDRQSRFPGASAGGAQTDTGESSAATTLALREEQDVRARAFLWLIFAIAVLTSVAMQLPERESPGKWAASACLASSGLAAGLLAFVARRRSIEDWPLFGFGVLATTTILVSIYHVGVFSPAVMALFVVVYFYGLGDHPLHGWLLLAMGAGGYVLLATLAATGVLSVDRAVFAMHDVERVSMTAATVVITAFLALTLWLARQSRLATVRAVSQLERAHLQIQKREALLHEARDELDKALDVGKIGRFSGQRVDAYVVEEVIGRGAMGEVYSGHHSTSGEPIAIKLLHLHAIDDPIQVGRFFREAEVTSSLMSPHIVRVLGSGHSTDGSPYLAMERLAGHDLAWHLRESRRLGLRETVDLVTQVSQALNVAQDAGIVHRDLKPQNLFLAEADGRGIWKVLDFGVSKVASAASTLTQGATVGTPSYMAPEQAQGREVDHRADIFALGIITYRALTGRPPFTGPDSPATMYNVVHVQPARPGELVDLPEDVDLILALALAKDRARRVPSANTFAAALRDAARGELDERLRGDARNLLAEQPWGSERRKQPVRN
jgi:serine/threonine-protein kinase